MCTHRSAGDQHLTAFCGSIGDSFAHRSHSLLPCHRISEYQDARKTPTKTDSRAFGHPAGCPARLSQMS
jgi:hypothetical protein